MMQKDKKYIAFVCSGNTCRSPMAEGIFNKLAEEKQLEIVAESFGTHTLSGMSVSENSVKVCAEIGVDLSKKLSVSVNDVQLDRYERFYCMSHSHSIVLSEYCNVAVDKITVLNVADPYGGDENIYRECREQIYNTVKEITDEYENRKDDGNLS